MTAISQGGKIIRIDTKGVRAAGRSAAGVKLLDLDQDDQEAAAMIIAPKTRIADAGGRLADTVEGIRESSIRASPKANTSEASATYGSTA